MISIVLSLVGVALLTLGLLSTTLHSGSTADTSVSNAPGVGLADDLVAQQSLSTALTTVSTAASTSGGYGSVDIANLSASDPSVTYVDGPTTGASTISITVTSGSGGSTGSTGEDGSAIGAAVSGAEAAGAGSSDSAVPGGAGGASGTVTLAARSSDGVCWLVWRGQGSGSWYGAQTGLASCTAPALSSAPSPGPVSSSGIGWQEGSFPAA
jgi:hypothetical protein